MHHRLTFLQYNTPLKLCGSPSSCVFLCSILFWYFQYTLTAVYYIFYSIKSSNIHYQLYAPFYYILYFTLIYITYSTINYISITIIRILLYILFYCILTMTSFSNIILICVNIIHLATCHMYVQQKFSVRILLQQYDKIR